LLRSGDFGVRDCRSSGFRHFLVLLCALGAADADRTNHLTFVDDRDAALEWSEIRQCRHREASFVDDVLEILCGFFEGCGRARFADGNVCAGGEASLRPYEIE